jgi:hypothetical protein
LPVANLSQGLTDAPPLYSWLSSDVFEAMDKSGPTCIASISASSIGKPRANGVGASQKFEKTEDSGPSVTGGGKSERGCNCSIFRRKPKYEDFTSDGADGCGPGEWVPRRRRFSHLCKRKADWCDLSPFPSSESL